MSLEKLLSENLRRFGVKNLIEQTKVSRTIYNNLVGTYTLQQMSGIINTYNPTKGYIQISDGNQWLANQRAKSLSKFFSRNVEKILGVPYDSKLVKINEAKVLGPGDENQYVRGSIYAILEKPARITKQYKYFLLYNFYEINGKPHILVTKRGMGSPEKVSNKSVINKAIQFASKVPANSKLIWQQLPMSVGNMGIMIPLPGGYAKKTSNRLFFNSPKQLVAMRNFIAKYTDGNDLISRNKTSSNWKQTSGGGGNYIFGDLSKSGATAVNLPITGYETNSHPDLTVNPEQGGAAFINPETVAIRRTSQDKGSGDATIAGTGTKAETRKIGDFKFDKTMFPDNMIRIKNSPELQSKLEEIKIAYNNVVLANPEFVVKSITSVVEGYASSDNATNRTNSGRADHGWGINWPSEKWITE